MTPIIISILATYFSLLLFASATAHHRDALWSARLQVMYTFFNSPTTAQVSVTQTRCIRLVAGGFSFISIYQLSLVYGASIGFSNWVCLVAVLACLVVVTLSYALSSLFVQLCLFGLLTGLSLVF